MSYAITKGGTITMDQTQSNAQSTPQIEYCSPTSASRSLFSAFEYMEIIALCLFVILGIYACGFRICRVAGDSMQPTLENGQLLLVNDIGYEPQYGDIVVFHQLNMNYPMYNEPIIKRVIATEGQHVIIDFKSGAISVDGQLLEENYMMLYPDGEYHVFAEHHVLNNSFNAIVPKGHVFLMGDNRNGSLDSRSAIIGFVDERRILGEAIYSLTPFEKIIPLH
jgi:signal peptidase I